MAKRLFDIVVSLSGLLLLFPLLLLIAAWIKLSSPGPTIYRGVRVGLRGKLFRIYKFRTMVPDAEKMGDPSTPDDDPRTTKVGRFLRHYKLDELPQFLNVLKGEMSVVGPRPEVPQEVALYSPEEMEIFEVRPGITDYASICFYNEGEILRGSSTPQETYREKIRPDKLRLELQYVRNASFWTDLKILFDTLLLYLGPRRKQET